jgi:HAD superfamily hydrolase (TIGR01450 family)
MPINSKDNLIPDVDVNETVDAVVVGYDNMISLPKLVKACTYANQVHPSLFIATNIDETFPTPNPALLVPGTGAFVNFVSTAVGRNPVVMGKPNASYWNAIKNVHPDIDPQRTLMIGDRLNTDISFGNLNGIGYTLLVETGVHRLSDAEEARKHHSNQHLVPTHFVASLNDLNKHL